LLLSTTGIGVTELCVAVPIGVEFALLLINPVFTNDDGSTGIHAQRLVTSDTTLVGNGVTTSYQKRWNMEPCHKSLKQNASLEKSPTQTVATQTSHFFAALCGYIKLELLKHFALSAKRYLHVVQCDYAPLRDSILPAWLHKVS
jgi:hypothetical protein